MHACGRLDINLRQHKKGRNQAQRRKNVFGVSEGQFLGFKITKEANRLQPEKVAPVLNMTPPRTMKEVHRLNGRVSV